MVAAQLNTGRVQVGHWRARYAAGGLAAMFDETDIVATRVS